MHVHWAYALNHTGDLYRMWNKYTNGVHVTRDVIWMKRMYYEKLDVVTDLAVSTTVIEEADFQIDTVDESDNIGIIDSGTVEGTIAAALVDGEDADIGK